MSVSFCQFSFPPMNKFLQIFVDCNALSRSNQQPLISLLCCLEKTSAHFQPHFRSAQTPHALNSKFRALLSFHRLQKTCLPTLPGFSGLVPPGPTYTATGTYPLQIQGLRRAQTGWYFTLPKLPLGDSRSRFDLRIQKILSKEWLQVRGTESACTPSNISREESQAGCFLNKLDRRSTRT